MSLQVENPEVQEEVLVEEEVEETGEGEGGEPEEEENAE